MTSQDKVGILSGGVFALAVVGLVFYTGDIDASEIPQRYKLEVSDLKVDEKFGIEHVTGSLNKTSSFACIQSKKYPDQVQCVFFPSKDKDTMHDAIIKMFERQGINSDGEDRQTHTY